MRSIARIAVLGVAFMVAGFGGLAREFAPDAERWERWEAHDPASALTVDHSLWDGWLARYVVDRPGVNLVRYGDVGPDGKDQLAGYLATLASVPVGDLARPEQYAYWINLYNALTVQVILDHYPVATIKDIDTSPGLFADGPWGQELIEVSGEPLTLNDIEHRILRPIWGDARIHYAVNCAAVGCPDLQPRAFTADLLETMLDAAARDFVNDPRGVAIEDGDLVVSSIYDWFYEDFGQSDADLLAHLTRYAAPALKEELAGRAAIDRAHYDWGLNAAR
ncbi:MAG: DUF547 domain-containing protein [Alphaproteobacteria bacterium]|nr:DUF547 domain-containing protein [Alphaproteobacteria bacterium]